MANVTLTQTEAKQLDFSTMHYTLQVNVSSCRREVETAGIAVFRSFSSSSLGAMRYPAGYDLGGRALLDIALL